MATKRAKSAAGGECQVFSYKILILGDRNYTYPVARGLETRDLVDDFAPLSCYLTHFVVHSAKCPQDIYPSGSLVHAHSDEKVK